MFLRIWSLHATWSSCLPFSKCVWIKIFHWASKEYQELSPGITAVDQYIVNQVHSTFLKIIWHCIFHNNVCIVQYSLDFSTILCCNTVLQYFGVSWEKLSKVLKTAAGGSSRVLRCRYNFRVFAPLQPRLVHYQPNQPSSMMIYSNFLLSRLMNMGSVWPDLCVHNQPIQPRALVQTPITHLLLLKTNTISPPIWIQDKNHKTCGFYTTDTVPVIHEISHRHQLPARL